MTDPEAIRDVSPDAERVISDVETLRALSDPLRLRILEVMVQRPDTPWTVKELAATLNVPQTRLYHHIELLLERDMIRAVERRVVQGIIETRYRVAALSLRLDKRLFRSGSPEDDAAVHEVLLSIFDSARDEIEESLRAGAIDTSDDAPTERRPLLSKGLARLSPAHAIEFRERLKALLDEYEHDKIDPDDPDGLFFGMFIAFYPLPADILSAEASQEPSDD